MSLETSQWGRRYCQIRIELAIGFAVHVLRTRVLTPADLSPTPPNLAYREIEILWRDKNSAPRVDW